MKKKLFIIGILAIVIAGISTKNISFQIGNGKTEAIEQARTGKISFDTLENIT
jgi:hypothetical protein